MEAWRFGFNPSIPPAFKFHPTDADIVTHYLLPRVFNLPNPHAHAVVDADPASCPPWELLRRHGLDGSDHAFFFAPPREVSKGEIARAARSVPAAAAGGLPGLWRGQKSLQERLVLVPAPNGGGEIVVTYRKFELTYYNVLGGVDKKGNALKSVGGWAMYEYVIVDPLLNPVTVLARVKLTDREINKKRGKKRGKKQTAAVPALAQVPPFVPPYQNQPQPGPNSNYNNYYHVNAGQAAAGPSCGSNDAQFVSYPAAAGPSCSNDAQFISYQADCGQAAAGPSSSNDAQFVSYQAAAGPSSSNDAQFVAYQAAAGPSCSNDAQFVAYHAYGGQAAARRSSSNDAQFVSVAQLESNNEGGEDDDVGEAPVGNNYYTNLLLGIGEEGTGGSFAVDENDNNYSVQNNMDCAYFNQGIMGYTAAVPEHSNNSGGTVAATASYYHGDGAASQQHNA